MVIAAFEWSDKTPSGPVALVVCIAVVLSVIRGMWVDRQNGKRFDGFYAGVALFIVLALAYASVCGFLNS